MIMLTHGFIDTPTRKQRKFYQEFAPKRKLGALELLESLILYCKYFGRLKISDVFLFSDSVLSKIKIVRVIRALFGKVFHSDL